MAFTVHLQHDGQPLSFILDIIEVAESHTGEAQAEAFVGMVREFGIKEKVCQSVYQRGAASTYDMFEILGMTADNAVANDTIINILAQKLPSFGGKYSHARCFDHITNLCAKSVLRPFDVEKKHQGQALKTAEKEIEALLGDIDLYHSGLDMPAGVNAGGDNNKDGFVDERDDMNDNEREELENSILPIKLLLTKVRG